MISRSTIFVTDNDFKFVQRFVYEFSRNVIDEARRNSVEVHLQSLSERLGFESMAKLMLTLRANPPHGLKEEVNEVLLNNETLFFRDIKPFETLKNLVIPRLLEERSETDSIYIWSAAASSGQEIYSVQMTLSESHPQLLDTRVKFWASDLSKSRLTRAQEGRYSQIEINRGMPAHMMLKYFKRDGMFWEIQKDMTKRVEFRHVNLIKPWPFLPKMDIIFLRNVLIYFDDETKHEVLEKVRLQLRPGGVLFLGVSESTLRVHDGFKRVQFQNGLSCFELIP